MHIDDHGRVVPTGLSASANLESRRYFQIKPHPIDLPAVYQRSCKFIGPCLDLSESEFVDRSRMMLDRLGKNSELSGLMLAHPQPFLLPKGCLDGEPSQGLQRLLDGLAASHAESCLGGRFVDHASPAWKSGFSAKASLRVATLRSAVSIASQVGFFVPNLSEYSVAAARELDAKLPPSVAVAGIYELAALLVASPDYLLNADAYSPMLWGSADIADADDMGFHFAAYGNDLTFNARPHLNQVSEYWWSGLVIFSEISF